MTAQLTAAEARRIAVTAQGLHSTESTPMEPAEILGRLGCIQIDSMSAVRRSHELVLLSRGVPKDQAQIFGTTDGNLWSYEGMAHALSLVPIDLWPALGFRRRRTLAHGWRGPSVNAEAVERVRELMEAQGQVRLRDLGGATGTGWERTSDYRWALEWLAATGAAVCAERHRWERLYSIPERTLPLDLVKIDLPDEECIQELCRRSIDALGVATTKDVADYFRLHPQETQAGLEALGLEQCTVAGWRESAWLSPAADTRSPVDDEAVTPLSPFDSLIWTRERQQRLFGKDYKLEAYKPAAKRTFGYFALPILRGSELAGRIALRRAKNTLLVENTELDPEMPRTVLERAVSVVADWTSCDTIVSERNIRG